MESNYPKTTQGELASIKKAFIRVFDCKIKEIEESENKNSNLYKYQHARDWVDEILNCFIIADFNSINEPHGHLTPLFQAEDLKFKALRTHNKAIIQQAIDAENESEDIQPAQRYAAKNLASAEFEMLKNARSFIPKLDKNYNLLTDKLQLTGDLLFALKKQVSEGKMGEDEYRNRIGSTLDTLKDEIHSHASLTAKEEADFVMGDHFIPSSYLKQIAYSAKNAVEKSLKPERN